MQVWDYIMLLPVGLLAGTCGGLLGIGGSVVMIPAMCLLAGPQRQHLYQAVALIVNFFVVAPAVIRHRQAGATLWPVTRLMVPSAMVGVVAGVYLSELPVFHGAGQGYLQIGFAVFLGYVFVQNLLRLRWPRHAAGRPETNPADLSKPAIVALVGIPTGLLGGLLGVGGGLLAVPAQQVVLKLRLPNAIANSATTILWSSVLGALLKNAHLSQHGFSWRQAILMALCLIPTAMIGSWYAAAKVHRWPVRVIRTAFAVLLLYCGVRLLLMGLEQVRV